MADLFKDEVYIDFHTHKEVHPQNDNIVEIVSNHLGKPLCGKLYTIGKHPWWTNEPISEEEQRRLKNHLQNDQCLALGEVGLDKFIEIPVEKQLEVLDSQLQLASSVGSSAIIHCVRLYAPLLEIIDNYPNIKNWVIHGYSRHKVLAHQLLDKGFYISLMPQVKETEKYVELVKSLPQDRFFLETDSMPNSSIENIYLQVSKIRNTSVEDLKKQLVKNARDFF